MAWAGSVKLPALLISRLVVAYGDVSAAFSNHNSNHRPRASLRTRVSKTPFARGSTEAACQFPGVVADKQCTCPAGKVMWERYPPTPPSFALSQLTPGAERRMPSIAFGRRRALPFRLRASDGKPISIAGNSTNAQRPSLISSASVGATPTPATSLRSEQSSEQGCQAVAS